METISTQEYSIQPGSQVWRNKEELSRQATVLQKEDAQGLLHKENAECLSHVRKLNDTSLWATKLRASRRTEEGLQRSRDFVKVFWRKRGTAARFEEVRYGGASVTCTRCCVAAFSEDRQTAQ